MFSIGKHDITESSKWIPNTCLNFVYYEKGHLDVYFLFVCSCCYYLLRAVLDRRRAFPLIRVYLSPSRLTVGNGFGKYYFEVNRNSISCFSSLVNVKYVESEMVVQKFYKRQIRKGYLCP